jgi:nitrogen fixation protein NifU and related proteins
MEGYSTTVVDHFENPRNAGTMDSPDGEAVRANPAMRVHIMLRIEGETIREVRWQTKGCPASIASSSFASEWVNGWTLEAVDSLERDSVAQAIGGLPASKMHCSALTAEVLKAAVADYREKAGKGRARPSV